MIFEKIDQEDDIGIDARLTFARRGPDAGRFVNVQVKGGRSYKRATHVDVLYKRRGMASLRGVDPMLWPWNQPVRGYEGHHWVDVDARLETVWRNARPTYVIVQDPDDDELYFGNLTRMVDMQPLDQDLAEVYEWMQKPNDGSRHHTYLAKVHSRIAGLAPDERDRHKTSMPLYPDLRLSPDGLDRFLQYALADARQPKPERQFGASQLAVNVRYPDGTIGPSLEGLEELELEALEAERQRLGLKLRCSRQLKLPRDAVVIAAAALRVSARAAATSIAVARRSPGLAARGRSRGWSLGRWQHPGPGCGACHDRDFGAGGLPGCGRSRTHQAGLAFPPAASPWSGVAGSTRRA